MTISIGELQKNISFLNKLTEPIIVIDKRTKKKIAKIEPFKDDDIDLFEKLTKETIHIEPKEENFEEVYISHLEKKYGIN